MWLDLPTMTLLLAALAGCAGSSGCSSPSLQEASAPAAAASAAAVAPAPSAASAASAPEAPPPPGFALWVDEMRARAVAAGINEATVHAAFDGVRYLPRVIELDRAQPEFTRAVWDYLDVAVSPQRVANGQEKLQQHRADMEAATARYGVPVPIVAAIWGVESNYGGRYGDTPAIDALATLGFEGRRAAWARSELLAALKILQSGDIDRAHMVGSWAGAMGHTQFIPSVFLAHAVDGDGDGRRDIWGSLPDVMASTANFVSRSGWLPGQPWGLEVQLPTGFDIGRADGELRQSSAQWSAEGVRAVGGDSLPEIPDATLFLPAGARGPVFLLGPNFRTILRYNNSTSYALAVGLLAQRLADGPPAQAPWPRDLQALRRDQVLALQTALNDKGFDSGTPDGLIGPATRKALRGWQRSVGLPADGYPTVQLVDMLAKDASATPTTK